MLTRELRPRDRRECPGQAGTAGDCDGRSYRGKVADGRLDLQGSCECERSGGVDLTVIDAWLLAPEIPTVTVLALVWSRYCTSMIPLPAVSPPPPESSSMERTPR